MIYSIPNTETKIIDSCSLTDDEVVFHIGKQVERIARKSFSTKELVETYGATAAAKRLFASHGDRTYETKRWQTLPLYATCLAVGVGIASITDPFIGLIFWLGASILQYTLYCTAYESIYRAEDPILFENVKNGVLNLRRIEALEIEEIDTVYLKHTISQMQSLVDSIMVARRIDPTTVEKAIAGVITIMHRQY